MQNKIFRVLNDQKDLLQAVFLLTSTAIECISYSTPWYNSFGTYLIRNVTSVALGATVKTSNQLQQAIGIFCVLGLLLEEC